MPDYIKVISRHTARVLALALILAFTIPLLVPPAASAAGEPRVDDVSVERDSPLLVSFVVKDGFNSDIEEAINSGIPTSFNFRVELDRVRGLWFDKHSGSWRFRHTVKYDTLKEEYEVTLEERGGKVFRTGDYREMMRLMTTVARYSILPERPLIPGRDYNLRIKAELHTIKMPFLLDYVLFFLKFLDVETEWYTHRFTQ